jgi:hypothetical protein
MTRINRIYVRRLEDLIVQLDSTFSDIESSHTKGYLARDMLALHKEADAIRASRKARDTVKRRQSSKRKSCPGE